MNEKSEVRKETPLSEVMESMKRIANEYFGQNWTVAILRITLETGHIASIPVLNPDRPIVNRDSGEET